MKSKKYLSQERSYTAVIDSGEAKWIDVGRSSPGSVIDAKAATWSENVNKFEASNKVYPYWVGTTLAWCPAIPK